MSHRFGKSRGHSRTCHLRVRTLWKDEFVRDASGRARHHVSHVSVVSVHVNNNKKDSGRFRHPRGKAIDCNRKVRTTLGQTIQLGHHAAEASGLR